MTKMLLFAALLAIPATASAVPRTDAGMTGYDPYASAAIERLDYQIAEDRLMRRLADDAGDVSAMLNLAAVMSATDRVARASSLYEQVLAFDNLLLELPDGSPAWSHDIAEDALDGRATMAGR